MKKNNDLVVVIQCRTSSSRLPGKAVKLLGGKPVLEWTLNSMKKVNADRYFLATDEASYKELQPIAKRCGWEIFVGPLEDVLERFCMLIREFNCKTILRATADNPFLFYEAAQLLCTEFKKQCKISKCDYMTWTGLPHGSGVEIFNAESLLKACENTILAYDHEHVGPAIYNHKNKFTSLFFKAPARFYYPDYRTTIDTSTDFRRALGIVNKLSKGKMPAEPYTAEQILSAVKDISIHNTVLFVPSVKKGCGTGHLRRCLRATIDSDSFIYIPENAELEETESIVNEYLNLENGLKDYQIVKSFPEINEFSLIVTDLFNMEKEIAEKFYKVSTVLSIDEGSDSSFYSDYLLDIIPSYNLKRKANLSLPSLIDTPKNKKAQWNLQLHNVLVCLGGEDPANLTIPASIYFAKVGYNVTSILKLSSRPSEKINNVTFIEPVVDLKEKLFEYDLVVTHYGLTAFEANSAGCAVILLATTKLHENLAKTYGFQCLSKRQLESPFKYSLFTDTLKLFPQAISEEKNQKSLGEYIKEIAYGKRILCPICNSKKTEADVVVARTKYSTFRRCRDCGIIYMSWLNETSAVEYEKSYFAQQYKQQYGKTYLEDFDSIKKTGIHRIMDINSCLKIPNFMKPTVLDIGCAYGPFLAAANESGWQVFGTDISKDAIEYVQNTLLFPATCSVFPDFDAGISFGINQFDAITMWYVIEHFIDLSPVLNKISNLLKVGGVFAFSTPSGQGVSAKLNKQSFFDNSPHDHYTIWEPSRVGKILQRFGFKVIKIVSTGHHAERFPAVKSHSWNKTNIMFKGYDSFSKICKLGDTFEVYCRKVK